MDSGSTVSIEFFDGSVWTPINTSAPNVPGTNSYITTLYADAPTEAARIKISSNTDPTVFTISEEFILADINIMSPIGGGSGTRDKWQIGTTNYVTWTAGGAGDFVDVEYTIDGGSNWLPVAEGSLNYPNQNRLPQMLIWR